MIPANTTGTGGTTVVYGADPEGPSPGPPVLDVYADLRCPYCKRMENALGATMRQLADDGDVVLHYHFATFLDETLGGHGSHRALNALGAAANRGQRQFMAYLRTLYRNQPHEHNDGFAEPRTLMGLANDVEGLRDPAFEAQVLESAFHEWVERVGRAFYESGVAATPTVLFEDRPVAVLDGRGHAVHPEEFTAQIHATA
ncbi:MULTISPECIES: thioredoxin domain-containing protein [unclassified Streptomyces]|uniref:DsbA family protein n=1 Tax=unclassified Streptomyces TaxID=2593676 RepID=UPI002DDA9650|nr:MULTISPECIES: thioredoxin domain-containing protein [unclassified Streptomyces]WSA91530.1 DsbA family protein [Streptomyces sp. NBC_01795]WSB75900.1 DsbA family protein [Streptomyces sp. NBC_01775]WSS15824.1 DsbA family protein [Streptomyces sp. NBC_01186]WSS44663.1 DsbA family protein [Streptomyces sp. NBC_01187]